MSEISDRKRLGAWYTPQHLVDRVVDAVIDGDFVATRTGRAISVIDPACGDGRFLVAALRRIETFGGAASLTGIDIEDAAIRSAAIEVPEAELIHGDALAGRAVHDDGPRSERRSFDLVIGNPPFLSQLAAATTRGGASHRGGGPYADAAVEFLALAAEIVDDDGGRVAFVLPQSLLAARDAAPVRRRFDERSTMIWSSWTGAREFDAEVRTCALAFEFGTPESISRPSWAHVITERSGVPSLPTVLRQRRSSSEPTLFDAADGAEEHNSGPAVTTVLGDRAWLNANFRDEYYGMVAAVGDHANGPPLVTSGLIDPGRSLWGERAITFAKRRFAAPRLDLALLDAKMRGWADKRLIPKVLVANQTPIIEAVCDPDGAWLPGVPVVSVYPHGDRDGAADTAWEIAAVLTSPAASAWAWHQRGGTGLSADTIRVGPAMLAELPWPAGELRDAVDALRDADLVGCAESVDLAYGLTVEEHQQLMEWWHPILERIERRRER